MFKHILLIVSTLLFAISLSAQTVPTSYDAAKRIGDAKLAMLQKANVPSEVQYVVLKRGCRLNKLIKSANTVYVIDKDFNLKGKTLTMPHNSVLIIRKGNIKNGTLVGQNTKYCIHGDNTVNCNLSGEWERIYPLYTASELGLKPNDKSSGNYNYIKLQEAIVKDCNIYLDGDYYVAFDKPILLDRTLHLFGGSMRFSKHAFDLTNRGGLYANGVHFQSMDGTHTDNIVCGTREKHPAITTGPITFLNCHFSCNRVLSLEFKYTNPDINPFGIKSLVVKNCYAEQNARFTTLDVPYLEECLFKNNTFTNFTYAPIYLTHNHSVRTHPGEDNANPWTEEIVRKMCDVTIDSNIFIGKDVSVYSYYCAALIGGKKCTFTNNYLKDLINHSDKNSKGYTAYDAYLSCVEVDYENNYVENMLSYAKDGAAKPQTEIGKSKMNPLAAFNYKASRRYVRNIYVCDGSVFRSKGADESSLTCDIFNNVSAIDTYVWADNAIIYKNITITGRASSTKYGSFQMRGNYFECSDISGNLIFANSAYDVSEIDISNNTFNIESGSRPVVFNQLYNDNYRHYSHGRINISDNEFINTAPVYHYFVADTVRIRNNRAEKLVLDGNLYLSDYTGNPRALQVRSLDVDITLNADNPKGGIIQFFSDESLGSFTSSVTSIPKRGILFHYLVGGKHKFKIQLNCNGEEHEVSFENDGRNCYYVLNGERTQIRFGQMGKKIWYQGNGLVYSTSFIRGKHNDIQTSVTAESGTKEGNYKLTYISL